MDAQHLISTPPENNMTDNFLELDVTALPASPQCGQKLDLLFTAANGTDDYITVDTLTFTLPKGKFPTNLADGYSNVDVVTPKGWAMVGNGGVFTATPITIKDGKVGPKGLEFQILNIVVNAEPGRTSLTMSQVVEPNKATQSQSQKFNKILPPLTLYSIKADPLPALYAGTTTISWEASVGAVIVLDANGVKINHVKGEPGTPLPNSGSYRLDDVIEQTVVTVTANAGASADSNAQTQLQTTVSIAPPTATLTANVAPAVGALPNATLNWATTSANNTYMTTSPPGFFPTTAINGTLNTPIVIPTEYFITATNPVVAANAAASASVTLPVFDWVPVGPGPVPATSKAYVLETFAGLAMVEPSNDGAFWVSYDGLNWSNVPSMPKISYTFPIYGANHSGTFFLSAGTPEVGGSALYSTSNFDTWTKLSDLPLPYALPPPITFDDAGNAWALPTQDFRNTIWKSTDQMQSWTAVGTPNLRVSMCTCFKFMGGKLWSIGYLVAGGGAIDCYSSVDGLNWTQHATPAGLSGWPSLTATVFEDKICLFVTPTLGHKATPMTLWRIDANGTWTQDPITAGQSNQPNNNDYPASVAKIGGTMFTMGNGFFTPTGGIWARNT
jgi:hypothetical protein